MHNDIFILLNWDEGYNEETRLPSASVFNTIEEAKASLGEGYDWFPENAQGHTFCEGIPYQIIRVIYDPATKPDKE